MSRSNNSDIKKKMFTFGLDEVVVVCTGAFIITLNCSGALLFLSRFCFLTCSFFLQID